MNFLECPYCKKDAAYLAHVTLRLLRYILKKRRCINCWGPIELKTGYIVYLWLVGPLIFFATIVSSFYFITPILEESVFKDIVGLILAITLIFIIYRILYFSILDLLKIKIFTPKIDVDEYRRKLNDELRRHTLD